MEIWFCDDNSARRQLITTKLSMYTVKAINAIEAEELMRQEMRPDFIMAHTTGERILARAKETGIPAVAIMDNESSIDDLRRVMRDCEVEVVDINNLEEKLEKILLKEYDITRPITPASGPGYAMTNWTGYSAAKGEVVVVASGKGGVGKTTIAACLALWLQKRGVEVCAVDFDFRYSNLGVILQVNSKRGFGEFLPVPENFPDNLLAVHRSGLKLLLPNGGITVPGVEKILEHLTRQYEAVVIDTGTDTGEHTRTCVNYATKVFLVTTLTSASIKNNKIWMRRISPRDATKLYLVINKFNKLSRAAYSVTSTHRVMGMNLAGVLPVEPKIAKGEENGSPLPERGRFAKEMMNLSNLVWPWKSDVDHNRRPFYGLRRFLSK